MDSGSSKLRVVIVCTSASAMGDMPTGAWSEEFTASYFTFKDAGCAVTLASVMGGQVPVDAKSVADDALTDFDKRFQQDEQAQSFLANTPKVSELDVGAFDCVFLAGGHGTCVDFADGLAGVVTQAYARGKVVAAVCHGPTGLVNAQDGQGNPLVRGKHVTGFTNEEEAQVGLTDKVPFLLEAKLRELGAKFEGKEPWTAHAVGDGNLLTGQNPQSTVALAKLALGQMRANKEAQLAAAPAATPSATPSDAPVKTLRPESGKSVEDLQALVYDLLQYYRGLQCQVWQAVGVKELDLVGAVALSDFMPSSGLPFNRTTLALPCQPHEAAQYLVFGTNETEWDSTCVGVEVLREVALPHIHGTRSVQCRLVHTFHRMSSLLKPRDCVVLFFMLWMDDGSFLKLGRSVEEPVVPSPAGYQRLPVMWHSTHVYANPKGGCGVEVITQYDTRGVASVLLGSVLSKAVPKQVKTWHQVLAEQTRRNRALAPSRVAPQLPARSKPEAPKEETPLVPQQESEKAGGEGEGEGDAAANGDQAEGGEL